MKRILSILLVLTMVFGLMSFSASADSGIKVILNGTQLEFDVQPQLINDRTMVPLRKIFESLGAAVLWEDSTYTVTATKGDITVVMQINNNDMTVNGEKITLDVPPQLVSGRTLVPVRAVAESFESIVEWDDVTQSVIITERKSIAGSVENNVYENKFAGFGFSAGEDWVFSSEEEIRELNNIVADVMTEEYQDAISKANIYHDMMASDSSGNNIGVNFEKADTSNITDEDISDIYDVAVGVVEDSFASYGLTNFTSDKTTMNIDGKDVDVLCLTYELQEVKLQQVSICIKCDGYLAAITVTAFSDEAIKEIIDSLYWID
ncbi:MAG: copper amine oxidase N-terminal domain-containing protein [Clostridia bacterium]|nr:copper amine oxidase N-terminal domain-containing protein [Clostridia bacterium]